MFIRYYQLFYHVNWKEKIAFHDICHHSPPPGVTAPNELENIQYNIVGYLLNDIQSTWKNTRPKLILLANKWIPNWEMWKIFREFNCSVFPYWLYHRTVEWIETFIENSDSTSTRIKLAELKMCRNWAQNDTAEFINNNRTAHGCSAIQKIHFSVGNQLKCDDGWRMFD